MVFEEELDDKLTKTDEGTEHGELLGGKLWNEDKVWQRIWETMIH